MGTLLAGRRVVCAASALARPPTAHVARGRQPAAVALSRWRSVHQRRDSARARARAQDARGATRRVYPQRSPVVGALHARATLGDRRSLEAAPAAPVFGAGCPRMHAPRAGLPRRPGGAPCKASHTPRAARVSAAELSGRRGRVVHWFGPQRVGVQLEVGSLPKASRPSDLWRAREQPRTEPFVDSPNERTPWRRSVKQPWQFPCGAPTKARTLGTIGEAHICGPTPETSWRASGAPLWDVDIVSACWRWHVARLSQREPRRRVATTIRLRDAWHLQFLRGMMHRVDGGTVPSRLPSTGPQRDAVAGCPTQSGSNNSSVFLESHVSMMHSTHQQHFAFSLRVQQQNPH